MRRVKVELSCTTQIRLKQQAVQPKPQPWAETLRQKATLAQDARRIKGKRTFRPVHPNIGIEVAYRKKLDALISAMNKSVLYWLAASFRANTPEMTELVQAQDGMLVLEPEATRSMQWRTLSAQYPICDEPGKAGTRRAANSEGMSGSIPERASGSTLTFDALPANVLRKSVRKLSRQWQKRFNTAAQDLARWFSMRAYERSSLTLKSILKQGGWSVEMKMTPAQQDILHATVQQNVSLIKSIPQRYFTEIEGMVMRSVQSGRDLQQLTNDLQRQFRVTRKRALLIARDQNNKATSALTRARQIELGITEALWVHSGAGKKKRPTHVRNHMKPYDVKEGWRDPAVGRKIHPGELINCRCISRSVIPGFS